MKKAISTLTIIWCFASAPALAGRQHLSLNDIKVTSVVARGTGCPEGTVDVETPWSGALVALHLSSFEVEARSTKKLDRKSCNLVVSLKIPEGTQIGLPAMVASGVAASRRNGTATVKSEAFFLRGEGESSFADAEFDSGTIEFFDLPLALPQTSESWSSCNGEAILRVNLSLMARASSKGDNAFAAIDLINIIDPEQSGLEIRSCH